MTTDLRVVKTQATIKRGFLPVSTNSISQN